jgi:hypothetical protein
MVAAGVAVLCVTCGISEVPVPAELLHVSLLIKNQLFELLLNACVVYRHHNVTPGSKIKDVDNFVRLSQQMAEEHGLDASTAVSEQKLRSLAAVAHISSSVVVDSVLGSMLAQEVIKAVSHSGQPAFNFVCFSADYNGANSADYCVVREFPIPAAVGAVAVIDGSNVSSASSSSSSSSSSDSAVNVVEMEILE